MDVGARTDVGRIRDNNEDAYRVVDDLELYVVSDGMGGEAHGEVASALAITSPAIHTARGVRRRNAIGNQARAQASTQDR